MKNYSNFLVRDFATDDFFCRWVLQPDEESDAFWREWSNQNPDKEKIMRQAKELILHLQVGEKQEIEEELIARIWLQINENTSEREQPGKVVQLWWASLSVAAAILLLAVVGIWWWETNQNSQMVSDRRLGWTEVWNKGADAKQIKLEDGTIVSLKPNSFLSYPTHFEQENREVVLRGCAFFEVSRDAKKPFLVFSQEIVTKVLGTSFIISAFEVEETIEVTVRTGKVAVYAQKSPDLKFHISSKYIMVTPNQKVVFNRKREELTKTLADKLELVVPLNQLPRQKFEEVEVSVIFEALEKAYQVEIVFDKATLEKCKLTTTLINQPLLERLSIICDALGLKYNMEGTRIIISGKGC